MQRGALPDPVGDINFVEKSGKVNTARNDCEKGKQAKLSYNKKGAGTARERGNEATWHGAKTIRVRQKYRDDGRLKIEADKQERKHRRREGE